MRSFSQSLPVFTPAPKSTAAGSLRGSCSVSCQAWRWQRPLPKPRSVAGRALAALAVFAAALAAAPRAARSFIGPGVAASSGPAVLCVVVACLGFGSCNMPVKRVDVRDGMFFNLLKSMGILSVGALQWWALGFYKFEPFAMLGGMLWATGNLLVPFIIQSCGLGVGQLVWSVTNMLTGWAVGTFGLLGKQKDPVGNPLLNYTGVAITIMSLGLFSQMRRAAPAQPPATDKPGAEEGKATKSLALGFAAALLAGVFLGFNFNPPTYLQQLGKADLAAGIAEHLCRHSPNAMAYVFSHYCGVFATTATYFLIYAATSKTPYYGKEVAIPGYLSGVMWAIAQVGWFQANGLLSYVVAFPLIVGVPGIIAAIWGVVLFGENRGRRNLTLLATIIAVQAAGVTLIAVSRG